MNKLKYILLTVFVLGVYLVQAQQQNMYTQYMNQLLSINPAYAGAKGVTSASIVAREQWVGLTGRPRTQTIFVHSPLNEEMGVGGTIISDKIGHIDITGLYGDYSYSISYPGQKFLAFGLKGGVSFYSTNPNELDLNKGLSDPNDKILNTPLSRLAPNFGVGVYISSPDYYLGLSVPKLISNRITEKDIESNSISREQLHLFFMGGYVFDIDRIFKFKPYFMLRAARNAPLSLDLTAQVVFIDKLWAGVTYRLGNSLGFMAQIQVTEQLKVGYAYDLTTSALSSMNNSGTHEVYLGFDFSFGRGRVRSPRYF